ncbi:hypothetical protein FH972_026533 [Carpinus fangiana]|uniref:Uncharacterized protein n=1 Tax=Carpinus fangiana TaxID=176857 RepID=A0A5N6L6T1_9ROSI|nr:hypothetical protein FH972_026533 [Carpinus fangiana]
MADYSITITNQSNEPQEFLLFQNLPVPNGIPSEQVFTNVYQYSGKIVNGEQSSTTFSIAKDYFAIYGSGKSSPDGKVRITTADSRSITLGPNGSYRALSTFDDKISPKWDEAFAEGKKTDTPGAFTIKTDTTFQYPNPKNIYIGCGAKDETGKVIPIQTWPAKGGQSVVMYPVVKFFIATGSSLPGTGVKANSLGDVLQIDFTTANLKEANFIYNSNGGYKADGTDPTQYGIKWQIGSVRT